MTIQQKLQTLLSEGPLATGSLDWLRKTWDWLLFTCVLIAFLVVSVQALWPKPVYEVQLAPLSAQQQLASAVQQAPQAAPAPSTALPTPDMADTREDDAASPDIASKSSEGNERLSGDKYSRSGRHGERQFPKKVKPVLKPASISINKATATQLDLLPGIGPKLAQRIIDYRKQVGGFKTLDDLMEVRGIGEKNFAKMQPFLKL